MTKVSVRFGVRGAFLLPNAAIFAAKIDVQAFVRIGAAVDTLREVLRANGQTEWADRLVFEKR